MNVKQKGEGKVEEKKGRRQKEEKEDEPVRATGLLRATFGVIESFAGTTKPYL